MSHILIQKSRLKTVTYKLEDTGLLIQEQAISGTISERSVAFEQMRSNYITVIKHQPVLLVLGGISFMIVIGEGMHQSDSSTLTFGLVLTLLFGFAYVATRARLRRFFIPEDAPLEFRTSADSNGELDAFLEMVFKERTAYLISRWGKISLHLDYTGQLENMNWLLTNRVITKGQYDEKIAELDALFQSQHSNLPFDFTPGARGPQWN